MSTPEKSDDLGAENLSHGGDIVVYPTKPAYSVDPVTREYVGDTVADPSPLEPGVWLLPANAFYEKPPEAAENEVAVMTDSGWSLSPDFRGSWYSKADGSVVILRDIGPLPENLTDIERPGRHYKWADDSWKLDENEELEAIIAQAHADRDRLLGVAAIRIAPLQDAVDGDEATDAEIVLLKKWKQYRIAVNRINQQPGFPRNITWPVEPSAS